MPQLIKTEMVVGTAKPRVWSQVATMPISGGAVLVLVNLIYGGESDVLEVAAIGVEILESARTQLATGEMDLMKMKKVFGELADEIGKELELSILGVRVSDEQLIAVGMGSVSVVMQRGEEMGVIFTGSKEMTGVMGRVQGEDVFMLITKELMRIVGREAISKSMKDNDQLDQLAGLIHGQEDSSMLAGVAGRVFSKMGQQVRNIPPKVGRPRAEKRKIDWSVLKKIKALGKRPIKIRQEQKKQNMTVGIVLLVILIVGVGVGVVSRSRVVRESQYLELESVVSSKISEANSISDLNPERAKDLLAQIDGEIESYLEVADGEEYLARARELSRNVEEAKQVVFRQEQVETKTLIELSVLGIDKANVMVRDKSGSIVIVDNSKHRLVGVSVDDRSSWEIDVSGREVLALGVYDGRGYMVTSEGVDGVELSLLDELDDSNVEREIERDDLWGEVTGIGMFGGNAYVLDTGQGEIWKYPRLTNGFGARRRWLGAGIILDLSNVVDMEVDGDIWIVTSTGKLERYSRGVPMSFSMEGFPAVESGKLMDPRAVATTEGKVYVLEAGANRVVVFDMESGRYEKQLVSEEFSDGIELVVIEDKGYVLIGDRVIEFGL